jgi:hypothetical protein
VAILVDWQIIQRQGPAVVLAAPNPSLTPGAAVLEPPDRLCSESLPKNKEVPSSVRRRVLEEYGLANAPEKAYEVDYLITPALGGSDDIHNLWPHSYMNTVWSAKVKDSLEDRLHELVCLWFAKNVSANMSLRRNAFIALMQVAEVRKLDDPSNI